MNSFADPNGERAPKPGDFGVCIRCSGVFAFSRGMRARELTRAERREAMLHPQAQQMRQAVQAIPDELRDG